jgi:hypothetical protein
MRKKFLTALGVLVVLLAAFAVVVAMQPSELRVERSATLPAAPAEVFAQVNDFHNWEAWSPWAKLDPACKNSFEGPSSGVGAVFKWSGNSEVGEGSMTITESKPNELVRLNLDFVRPFEGHDKVEFTFKPEGDQTRATWTMVGQKNFVCKGIGLFMSMDKMLGGQFEEGFANMKAVLEKKKATAEAK